MMIKKLVPTYWYRSANFGDCLAPYLVEKITGDKAVYVDHINSEIEKIALVGSLLDNGPFLNTHVWGCGFVFHAGITHPPKQIHAVRGELTRKRYLDNHIECPESYGDPALLLPLYYQPEVQKKFRLGIIPHVVDFVNALQGYANKYDDVLIINPTTPVELMISLILSCEKTISSTLHGLIASHAYGVPSRWVEFSDKVTGSGFKFRDYFTTVVTNPRPLDLRTMPDLKNVEAEIPQHEITVSSESLLSCCPLQQAEETVPMLQKV